MFAAKCLMRAAPLVKTAPQSRQMSVIASYPLVRMPFSEKLIHGAVMVASFVSIPAWVLVHLRSYKGLDK